MVATPSEDAAESAAELDGVASALMNIWSSAHSSSDVPVPSAQLRALFVLERGPVNVSRLADELDALVSSASRLCDRLEASGMLTRDHGRDRREVTVRLSGDGQALLDRLRARRREELARVLASMPVPARAALLWGLSEFHAAASGPESGGGSVPLPA